MIKKYGDPSRRPKKEVGSPDKPFTGMMISLMGRLTRTHVCSHFIDLDPSFVFLRIDVVYLFDFINASNIGDPRLKDMEGRLLTPFLVISFLFKMKKNYILPFRFTA